jgi:transcriptional regulator of acetoin/glycerol metabolism
VALTGEPVLSETLHGQAVAAPEFQSRSLGAARPDLDSWLINWIDRALAFEPDARWPSAAAMLDWLQKHCGGRRSAEAAAPIAQWKPNIALVELDTLDDTETPPSSQTKRLALQLVRSPEASGQRSIELVPGSEIILGRDQSLSTWCIRDERVSRCHAAVRWDNDAKDYLIVDRSSKNGINVNGTRINAAHLAPGDVIRAGESLIVVIDKQRQSAFQQAVEFASRSSVAVLLHGETGVGKERLAREVHRRSGRRGSFIAVDCAALSTNLAAGEPFGRGLGAFLAAPNSGFSLIHEAEQGTLFLDNINELPIELQPAVSQILRERTDGAKRAEPFDVRIIAATTVPIEERVRHGQFRLDLYARLQAFNVHLPPLRERREQILTTLTDLATSQRQSIPVDCDAAEAILLNHWPTNVCGLQQLLHEVLARGHADSVLDIRALREYAPDLVQNWRALQGRRCSASRQMPAAKDILKERFALQQCIEENDGNISRVAKSLGVTRTQVYRWMNRLGIKASPRPIRAGK